MYVRARIARGTSQALASSTTESVCRAVSGGARTPGSSAEQSRAACTNAPLASSNRAPLGNSGARASRLVAACRVASGISASPSGSSATFASRETSEVVPKQSSRNGVVASQARALSRAAPSRLPPVRRCVSSAAVASTESTKPGWSASRGASVACTPTTSADTDSGLGRKPSATIRYMSALVQAARTALGEEPQSRATSGASTRPMVAAARRASQRSASGVRSQNQDATRTSAPTNSVTCMPETASTCDTPALRIARSRSRSTAAPSPSSSARAMPRCGGLRVLSSAVRIAPRACASARSMAEMASTRGAAPVRRLA
jgi:hypothetical protein